MPTTVTPSTYSIELRDSDFNLKQKIEMYVTKISWEWNRLGGCGKCLITIDGDYLRFKVEADDDIRIYIPNATSGATLWYRGYVEMVTPFVGGDTSSIQIECMGYFGWVDRIIIHDSGEPKVYTAQEISATVSDIVTNFLDPSSPISAGTIQASAFTPDELSFKVTARDALRTLYDLLGTVEYGVDASLNFFWYNQSDTITYKYYIGDKITKINDRVDYKNIVNSIFFEGGTVDEVIFAKFGQSTSSQNRYGKHEAIISNGSIITNSVASQFISSTLAKRAKPQRQMSVSFVNLPDRLESTLPIGAISIVDPDDVQVSAIYGTTGNGGDNKIYGRTQIGGSGQLYGGVKRDQVDRITYTLSPENGRINAEIQFGSSLTYSRASATLNRIDQSLNAVRQRGL